MKEKRLTYTEAKAAAIKELTAAVKSLNMYRPEFDMIIRTTAEIIANREMNYYQWKDDGFDQVISYTNASNITNLNKSPYFDNHHKYNEQLLKYYKALGLTPEQQLRTGALAKADEIPDDFCV